MFQMSREHGLSELSHKLSCPQPSGFLVLPPSLIIEHFRGDFMCLQEYFTPLLRGQAFSFVRIHRVDLEH
jgi:hypothetical protein